MINGSITIKGIDDVFYTINPLAIMLIAPSTPMLAHAFGCDPTVCRPRASIVMVNSVPLQMAESREAIVKKINRLKKSQEDHFFELKKRSERSEWETEDWEDEDDDEE